MESVKSQANCFTCAHCAAGSCKEGIVSTCRAEVSCQLWQPYKLNMHAPEPEPQGPTAQELEQIALEEAMARMRANITRLEKEISHLHRRYAAQCCELGKVMVRNRNAKSTF